MAALKVTKRLRKEMSRFHSEIWDACLTPAIHEANNLIDARKGKAPSHLLHFTSARALASILPNRTLRVSRARSSNDPKELEHAHRLVREEQKKLTSSELDQIFEAELFASLEGRLTDGTEMYAIDPHICCFTESANADVIAHWAMYGRDGSGFALKFKGKAMDNTDGVTLVRVTYRENAQRAHLREVLRIARNASQKAAKFGARYGGGWPERSFRIAANALGGIVSLHASAMKAPEFAAEREWRLIHPGANDKDDRKFGLDAVGPVLRTYFDVPFKPDHLVSVVVGPIHADSNRPIVKRLLERYGYDKTKVETGSVALRTLQTDR